MSHSFGLTPSKLVTFHVANPPGNEIILMNEYESVPAKHVFSLAIELKKDVSMCLTKVIAMTANN